MALQRCRRAAPDALVATLPLSPPPVSKTQHIGNDCVVTVCVVCPWCADTAALQRLADLQWCRWSPCAAGDCAGGASLLQLTRQARRYVSVYGGLEFSTLAALHRHELKFVNGALLHAAGSLTPLGLLTE